MTQDIIRFEQGMPGFEDLRAFRLLDMEQGVPFKLLQSVEQADISLVVGDPFFFYPEYEWELPDSVKEELGLKSETEVEVWSVITVSSDVSKASINLLAPLVINRVNKIGKQHILHDSTYGPRHPLLRPTTETTVSKEGEG
jgi:flagellar assembly factor FliW